MSDVQYNTRPACLSFLSSLSTRLFNYLTVSIIIMFLNLCPRDHDLSSHPPFSFCVASHALLLLYFPRLFFSPLFFFFVLTSLLLSTCLGRHRVEVGGLAQLPPNPPDGVNLESANNESSTIIGTERGSDDQKQDQDACELEGITAATGELADAVYTRSVFHSSGRSFVDWGTKWPLEVIYEEYEGEEADHEEEEAASIIEWNRPRSLNNESHNEKSSVAQGFEEWGLCLPDSDDTGSSGSSEGEYEYPSELPTWESLENHHVDMLFMLKEEGMIEIPLVGKAVPVPEEDSLIEIDLSLK